MVGEISTRGVAQKAEEVAGGVKVKGKGKGGKDKIKRKGIFPR